MTSLFTKDPIPKSVAIIQDLLSRDDRSQDLTVLVGKGLTLTYCLFQGHFYQQFSDTPMASPLSSIAADIFMDQ